VLETIEGEAGRSWTVAVEVVVASVSESLELLESSWIFESLGVEADAFDLAPIALLLIFKEFEMLSSEEEEQFLSSLNSILELLKLLLLHSTSLLGTEVKQRMRALLKKEEDRFQC
jgi:hypothetical protein